MNNKGQSSLELTTTYSWAILIIIIVVAAIVLYYESDRITTPSLECVLGPQFACQEAFVDSYGQFDVKFRNNINEEITVQELNFSNWEVNCPALPVKVKQGGIGKLQCNFDGFFEEEDVETIIFDISFTVSDEVEVFVSKARINTKIVPKVDTFQIDCDADGDGKDKIGCGDSLDCDDTDFNVWLSACFDDSDCSPGQICKNSGSCDAYCENSCDMDSDGAKAKSCGGIDCDDNNPSIKGPVCKTNSDCSSGLSCLNPNTCASYCGRYIIG